MSSRRTFRGLLSAGLAAALFFFGTFPANAMEVPTETTVETTSAATEAAVETTASTLPSETTEATEAAQAVTEATVPEETEEAESYSLLGTTLQPQTLAVTPIAQARALPAGTEGIVVQGTVVFTAGTQVVLQDDTGGMRLTFPTVPAVVLGDVLLVTGSRSGGFSVTRFEKTGTAQLPAVETTIREAPENTRILLKAAILGEGLLTQEETSISLTATLPANAAVGDRVDVYGVVMDGWLHADTVIPLYAETEEPKALWQSIALTDILPTDIVAVTVTKDGRTWALSSQNGETAAPTAVEVTLTDGMLETDGEGLRWRITQADGKLTLSAGQGVLYTLDGNDALRVGISEDSRWELEEGYLRHTATGRYLCVYQETAWQALMSHQGEVAGQTIRFWHLPRVASVGKTMEGETGAALHCATVGAVIYYATSADGIAYSEFTQYTGPIPTGTEPLSIKAYAVKEGHSPSPETVFVFNEREPAWNFYFGQLHAHTDISDGEGSVWEAFQHAAGVEGLDFFAVTDHSNSFDNGLSGAIGLDGTTVSTQWAEGKAAAGAVTNERFVGMFGFEMTWQGGGMPLGHINTFNTLGWQTREQPGFDTLQGYYEVLTTVPESVSQFNHPNRSYGDFENFAHYSPAYDDRIHLLEVGSENGTTAYEFYTQALDRGWHVAPANNQNNHHGLWGDASSVRTVVLAEQLTADSLFDAMRNYRVYATADQDLTIEYRLNGYIMGSILTRADSPQVSVVLSDPTDDAIGKVEVIVDGGAAVKEITVDTVSASLTLSVPEGYRYYYLRITQPDGDIAVTAPVWVESRRDMGIRDFVCHTLLPVQGEEVSLTLELYNNEAVDMSIEAITFSTNGVVVHTVTAPAIVEAGGTFSYTIPFLSSSLGSTEVLASVEAIVEGEQRSYEKTLTLDYQLPELEEEVSTLADVRGGEYGQLYCVQGYVTAGTANPYTTFRETIYLQDDTGGIAVMPFTAPDLQIGAPLEVTGYLWEHNGNPILKPVRYTVLEGEYYRHVPRTMTHELAMNYSVHSGELLQVEGQVISLEYTADGKGISRLILQDIRGDLATVVIEDNIRSGVYGTNELAAQIKTGRTVRAMGLLHLEETGESVLRVRNCDEVVYVAPTADPTNPKTGDSLGWLTLDK